MAELSVDQPRQAIALGREILTERPSMGVVYVYLSTVLLRVGEAAEAIEVMRQAERLGVASRDLKLQLGLSLLSAGKPAEAVDVLRPLAGAGNDEARNFLGLAYTYLGRYDDAEALFRGLLAANPEAALVLENLSFLAITRQRYDEARKHARRAVELDPAMIRSWNNLGVALYNLDRKADAIEAWKKSLALAPTDADTLLNLGMVQAEVRADANASGSARPRIRTRWRA